MSSHTGDTEDTGDTGATENSGLAYNFIKNELLFLIEHALPNNLDQTVKEQIADKILNNQRVQTALNKNIQKIESQGLITMFMGAQELDDAVPIPEFGTVINGFMDMGVLGYKSVGNIIGVGKTFYTIKSVLNEDTDLTNSIKQIGNQKISDDDINKFRSNINGIKQTSKYSKHLIKIGLSNAKSKGSKVYKRASSLVRKQRKAFTKASNAYGEGLKSQSAGGGYKIKRARKTRARKTRVRKTRVRKTRARKTTARKTRVRKTRARKQS